MKTLGVIAACAMALTANAVLASRQPGESEKDCKARIQKAIDSVDARARQQSTEYLTRERKRLEDARYACSKPTKAKNQG